MLELAAEILPILRSGARLGVVTVTDVVASAPRGAGSSMAVTEDARLLGSISGGCVEADAVALAQRALVTGRASTARLGFSDDAAFAAGLACGGAVDVIAFPAVGGDAVLAALQAVVDGKRAAIEVHREVGVVRQPVAGDVADPSWLRIHHHPRRRLIVAGASEHAAALTRLAVASGFHVTVVDPWELLLTEDRFPGAHALVVDHPDSYLRQQHDLDGSTAVCVLTHDERLDVPALEVALRLPIGFVGALGARSTATRRASLLEERGLGSELHRLHSPLGLDLGGLSVEDTAISILAEIVASQHGGSGRPLRHTRGRLHARVT